MGANVFPISARNKLLAITLIYAISGRQLVLGSFNSILLARIVMIWREYSYFGAKAEHDIKSTKKRAIVYIW
jgi:hypothetical protein